MHLSIEFTCFTYKYLSPNTTLKIFKKVLIYSALSLLALFGLASAILFFYKDDLIYMASMQINKHLITKVDISKKIDISLFEKFPELSVGFQEVKIYEPNSIKPTVFASLERVLITFDLFEMWKGDYQIDKLYLENGFIHLRTDFDGSHNFMIFKKDTTANKEQTDFAISYIQFKKIEFIYDYKLTNHFYGGYFNQTDASLSMANNLLSIELESNILTDEILINENSFLPNKDVLIKSTITYQTDAEILTIKPSSVKINESNYLLNGFYDLNKSYIDFSFKAEKSNLSTFTSILPSAYSKVIQEYQSSGNIHFNGTIKGSTYDTESPAILVNFGFENASFFHPKYKQQIKNAFLVGTYTNGSKRDLSTSSVKLSNIKLEIDGKNIEGFCSITDFSSPYVDLHLKGSLVLDKILKVIPNHIFEQASGEIGFDVEFKGRTEDLKSKKGYEHIQTTGDLSFRNVITKIKSYPHIISIDEAYCIFTKNDISIDNMHLKVGKNDVVLTGIFRNLIGKLILPNQSVYVQADLAMGNIFLEDILMSDTRTKKSSNQDFIMPALKDYKLDLNLKAASMNYQRLHARNISTKIDWVYPYLNFTNTNLNFCNGTCTGRTSLKILNEKSIEINTDSKIKSMDIDSVFYVFENFSQTYITNKNLKGKISTDLSLILQLDNHLNILPSSIVCDADVSIVNGELNNFETMKRISRFLETDDLDNIKFSEINNHFSIYNEVIQIPDMTINSTAGKISFSGTHSFDGKILYHVAYPIANLKKNKIDSDAAFGALRQDPKGEMKLFLIVQGTTSDFKITYDKKKVAEKIKSDLQKEKNELKSLFKKKDFEEEQLRKTQEEEYFDFE
ncbi:AsmA-like C-terminal region-containing protein [uncultured Cytophaga sp.]|uniref:AsmA family protein n=1 Tax=uncultured Cytophaga sp. TaxID=160238 RepID=UPI00262009DC|nr:AsmA-like C-terminal region-containing protein [uncultured Cytophaga sp.]